MAAAGEARSRNWWAIAAFALALLAPSATPGAPAGLVPGVVGSLARMPGPLVVLPAAAAVVLAVVSLIRRPGEAQWLAIAALVVAGLTIVLAASQAAEALARVL